MSDRDEWQPISTAPAYTPVLIYHAPSGAMATAQRRVTARFAYWSGAGFGGYDWDFDWHGDEPTHWRPLPPPPRGDADA